MDFRRGLRHGISLALGMAFLLGGAACGRKGGNPLVCLVTDYGGNEEATAQLKGSIYAVDAQARVVDLIHDAAGSDIRQTAYLIDQATANFAAGTVFVIAIDPASKDIPVLVRTRAKKFYLAPDDGALSFVIAREGLEKAWRLDKEDLYRAGSQVNGAYPASDVAGPVAARLALGEKPELLGTEVKGIKAVPIRFPTTAGQTVQAEILYVDPSGALVTNIPLKLAPWLKEGNLLRFTLGRQKFTAPLLSSTAELSDLKPGKYAALYNPQGRLEILVVKGSAARVFNANAGQTFLVQP